MVQKKIQDIYPLSPMQQGMLFHSLLEPDSGAYIIQTSYELHGQLDLAAFAKSWQQLVDRHPILRTAFVWENLEQPLQVVGTKAKISLVEHDWHQIPAAQQHDKLRKFLQELKTTGFNLNKAPLMRLDLIKMRLGSAQVRRSHNQSQVYQFIWSYHHLLLDGWSVPLLIKELLAYYQSFAQNLNIALPTAFPYKNYIAWLKQQDKEQALNFWREELKDIYADTSLGIANNITDKPNASYHQQDLQLSAETTYKLEFIAREYQITLNTLIHAAWAILLHRYSGDNDVIFGATTSGRPPNLANSQTTIGLFINTLPVRVQINREQLLIDWLKQLQVKQIARQEYEYTSLIDLHRVSDVPKDTSLFQSIVVFENYPVESSLKQSLDVLDIRNIKTSEQTNYPLTLYAAVDSQLSLKLLYNSQLFGDREINNILQYLKTLLQGIAANPQQKVGELNILSGLEKEQLLTKANSTMREYPQSCFHQLFEDRVGEAGEKIALIADDESLSYRELNQRANQLAHYLKLQGVCKGEQPFAPTVGIYLERDSSLIVSLLAVLKIGAAYVPLDPSYPNERISYIINQAQISHIITKGDIDLQALNSDRELFIIDLEAEQEVIQQQSTANLDVKISPQYLAYVIYTSGSTGKPKGVAVQHSSLVNFLYSMKQEPGITESDRLLAVTTISFDIAALEIYLPLLVGATVVIAPSNTLDSDRTLAERIEQHQITMMQATPITWRMLLADNWQGNKQLKILSGGEALEPQLAKQLLAKSKEVWNLYGPTETTIWSSVYQIKDDEDRDPKIVPIGKAIANTQFYILDSQLNLVPSGMTGELYIGGAGTSRGYLNQPDLTAERFIPNPFVGANRDSPLPQHLERLYKTGDRVKQLPDGNLEYIGRNDNQVKLRGFRIELGEVEAVLNQHSDIQTSVVLAKSDRLIAYIVLNPTASPATEEIRRFLAERLPIYMIPGSYVVLEKLPLTPNGKVDRAALVTMDTAPAVSNTPYKKPQSEIERAIAEIWQNVLQVEQVSLTDNFFDLGGQSLLMIRVHGLLKDKLGVDISLVDMFRYPTVISLAKYCQLKSPSESSNYSDRVDYSPQIEAGKNRLKQRLKKRKA